MTGITKLVVGASGNIGGVAGDAIRLTSLADLLRATAQVSDDLLWITDAEARPAPGALEALVESGATPAVSMPVDRRGFPIERLLGRFGDVGDEEFLHAVSNRQLPLRHTRMASMLVERLSILEVAPPDPMRFGSYAATEWTARLFARHPGTLVTASRVAMPPPPPSTISSAIRMSRARVWRRGETLRELYGAVRG